MKTAINRIAKTVATQIRSKVQTSKKKTETKSTAKPTAKPASTIKVTTAVASTPTSEQKPIILKPTTDYKFPVELQTLKTSGGITLLDKAVVRTDTKHVLGVVGNRYKIITHADVVEQIESQLPVMVGSRKINVCKDGAFLFARYESPKIDSIEVKKGDIVKFGIELFNSYNGRIAVGMRLLAFRLACSNGMTVPKSICTLQVRHLHGAKIQEAREAFNKKIQQFRDYADIWKKWTKAPVKRTNLEAFGQKYLPQKATDIILDKFDDQEDPTIWGAFNAVTWFGTHVLRTKNRRNEKDAETVNRVFNRDDVLAMDQFAFDRNVVEKFYGFRWNN